MKTQILLPVRVQAQVQFRVLVQIRVIQQNYFADSVATCRRKVICQLAAMLN
jgi:hypothetical protein